jgi:dolichol-phosphate mannosyltransferase
MRLSVVIPAHNEEGCIRSTVDQLATRLSQEGLEYEVVVVNDNSTDGTENILKELTKQHPAVRYVNNQPPHGFGFAVRRGLECFVGDAVAVYMADASDSPEDLINFYHKLAEGYDCVFGTRWSGGGLVFDYPWPKRFLNRMANRFIQLIMQIRYDDVTNAFKLYRREVIQGCQPILAYHYNLTVELPLKAIVRGYSYAVVPNTWHNRRTGQSKLRIKEMGSRYLFIVLYCFLEKWLSRRDYHRANNITETNCTPSDPVLTGTVNE